MKKIDLIVDWAGPLRLAEFWSEALGYEKVLHFVHYTLLSRGGPGFPRLALQRVPEPKAGKDRMPLDIVKADIEAEAARLETLGPAASRTALARRRSTRPSCRGS